VKVGSSPGPIEQKAECCSQGRPSPALDWKNFLMPAVNFSQLQDGDESSHDATGGRTELRGFGIGTLLGVITRAGPGEDGGLTTRSLFESGCGFRVSCSASLAASASCF
jgi:hypothetical protein